ncbi:hypothetical protein D3C87_2198250 [compost metagenome]
MVAEVLVMLVEQASELLVEILGRVVFGAVDQQGFPFDENISVFNVRFKQA